MTSRTSPPRAIGTTSATSAARPPLRDLPHLVGLLRDGRCDCGEVLAIGERVGAGRDGRLFCLWCLADLQQGRARLDPWVRPSSAVTEAGAQRAHSVAVAARAGDLANRLTAARALGTLASTLQPLEARAWSR
ncbi:hypothetical protein [Nostocoides sp. HKS02]|uniref:hypothetical protein n=1 Tax=Nostocoides sp. HKS02 TaxID=1813880 RepID=UPI0012B4FF75|nr:hypothetical protein [Tetrasphaera sp. HKS02]QGN57661.1 hypothetical protein GKE56_06995 [Tetrasphaera sp. HKS02]